jgi:hypothetical protein
MLRQFSEELFVEISDIVRGKITGSVDEAPTPKVGETPKQSVVIS